MDAKHTVPVLDEGELIQKILESKDSSTVVPTILQTDERVIARVTDGIYRQPGSALRELISNAYDADATRVIIKTDPPRFQRISVEDNGLGMGPEALANLLLHIGGSAKRHQRGVELGVTDQHDPLRSPGGRRLIGKIGIGLFSVSQLTHEFQIITKVRNDPFRTIATVALKQYSEDGDFGHPPGSEMYESGKVNIWREQAADRETQGTTVVLTKIRAQARDTLRSLDIWSAIEQAADATEEGEKPQILPPRFHIGRIDPSSGELLLREIEGKVDSVPWQESDSPEDAFRKLVDSVWKEAEIHGNPNPQLDRIFDYYLRMVWQLALAVPLPYVGGNLFDLDISNAADVFLLANQPNKTAQRLDLSQGQTIREALNLKELQSATVPFEVFFDDLKLLRPIKFRNLPATSHALKKPIAFIGKCREEFSQYPRALSGGPLAFEAYLFWNAKIAPTEHRGSLIRIHGASGTLFDPTFMRYQVSEQTRLTQITCEIFVSEGLDGALNIDRESFNYAHPHSVYITKWLHNALRQLATAQKKLAGGVRGQAREEAREAVVNGIERVVNQVWHQEAADIASSPPTIVIADREQGREPFSVPADAYVFPRSSVIPDGIRGNRTQKAKDRQAILETKLKAIAQLLASFGLLDSVPRNKQEKLLEAIFKILEASDE